MRRAVILADPTDRTLGNSFDTQYEMTEGVTGLAD